MASPVDRGQERGASADHADTAARIRELLEDDDRIRPSESGMSLWSLFLPLHKVVVPLVTEPRRRGPSA
jgi:hypothetical protein